MSRPHIDQADRDALDEHNLIEDDRTPDLRTEQTGEQTA